LAKEAQDPARLNIFSSSGILVTNFQSPLLSFYSNDFEFFPVPLGQELVLVSFQWFSYGSYTVKKMDFRWRKSRERSERDIERALGSRGTFLSRAGVGPRTSQLSWFVFCNEFSSQASMFKINIFGLLLSLSLWCLPLPCNSAYIRATSIRHAIFKS